MDLTCIMLSERSQIQKHPDCTVCVCVLERARCWELGEGRLDLEWPGGIALGHGTLLYLVVGLAPTTVCFSQPAALNTKGWILLYVNFNLIKNEKELYR